VSVKNPFFIPAPPSLSSETVQLRFYQGLTYPEDSDGGTQFRKFGTTSGFQWSNSSLLQNVQHSQVMPFSFLMYISASQFFRDSNFQPIETNISGVVTVMSGTSDTTSTVLCDKAPSKQFAFALSPELFWAKLNMSLAFCSPQSLNGQSFTLTANATANLTAGRYVFDVEVTQANTSQVFRILEGIATVTPNVTR
jgi:hypothetical protein